jgi:hypothetical protein
MIPKQIDLITIEDIQALKSNKVMEKKTIDYKQSLPGRSGSERIGFLADITAFANTVGGDLIFGITEEDGIPKSIDGVEIGNPDEEKLRLENIIRSGIEPRISDITICPFKINNTKRYILLIRVKRSWNAPHRVIFKDHSKFYGRNSAGKYPLDVSELKTAFMLSEQLPERIRRFHRNRAYEISSHEELPVSLLDCGKMVFHLIPLSAFSTPKTLEITLIRNECFELPPIGYHTNFHQRINIDGAVIFSSEDEPPYKSYNQLYRSGIIEIVSVFELKEGDRHLIHSHDLEYSLIEVTGKCLKALCNLEIEPPIYVFLTLAGIQNYIFAVGSRLPRGSKPLDRDVLSIPEVVIDNYNSEPHTILRPIFDIVWNSFGLEGSLNYDEEGNWRDR